MTKVPQKKTLVLTKDQLRAIVPARTKDVLSALRTHGPMTVPQLQEALGFPSKTVYYQVKKLVDAGILTEDGTAPGPRRDAVVYRLAARQIVMPSGFQGSEYEALAADSVASSLRRAIRRFKDASQKGEERPELIDSLVHYNVALRLSPKKLRQMMKRVEAVVHEYRANEDPAEPPIEITVTSTPTS